MLRGISSCLRGSRLPTRRQLSGPSCDRPFLTYTLLLRDFSSVGVEQGENFEQVLGRSIDQSFTSTHYVQDGRKFQFATVVVRAMKKGESPLRIWEQACSLIGENSPTLAVAFVSKPTVSAIRSVQVLAGQLSASLSKRADLSSDLTSQPHLSKDSSDLDAGQQASRISTEAQYGAEHVPLIGCIMDDSGGEIETSDDSGSGTIQVNPRGSHFGGLQFRTQANGDHEEGLSHFVDWFEGQEAEQTIGGLGLGSFVRTFDAVDVQEEDEDGEDGTVSDWENLCSEYSEEAIKVLDSRADSEDDEEDCENEPVEQISKEGLVSFLNALARHRNPFEDSAAGGDLRALKGSEKSAGMQRTSVGPGMESDRNVFGRTASDDVLVTKLESYLNSLKVGSSPRHSERMLGSEGLFGDFENAISVEPRNGGDKAGVSGSDLGKEDVNYKLILCVGHLPGVKVVGFHSLTTGLPRLPDLENAVLENNPHMLLFGAPGFVFPDFIQRLSSVFPTGYRAGAFLSPLFTRKKNQWARDATEKEATPVFFGAQNFTSGVVGLAISSKVKGLEVPVGAVSEFARMSLGMPRIQGYIFLDEAISKNLFLPNNVSVQNAFGSSKGSKFLNQLNQRLLKESGVPSRSQVPEAEISADLAAELILAGGLERSESLPSVPAEEDSTAFDRLPLALLDAVLFPGWSMPIYIYEPCYRLMVRQSVEQGKPFGLSSMCSDSWAVGSGGVIGTLVNLKIHTLERDCRSYIIAHGVRRFKVVGERIWSEPGSFGLNMGQVQFFDDKESATAEEKQELLDLAKRAVALCCEVVSEAQSAPGLVKSAHDPILASFAVGHVLNVPTRVKRRWLQMINTKTRLLEQIQFLETKATTSS